MSSSKGFMSNGLGAFTALALIATTTAHINLNTPVPFDWPDPSTKTSPITAAQFPCKMGATGAYTYSQINKLVVGQPNELSFGGSASHNGGTCQLAISLDATPTPDSVWKIIQVYEGGCPAKGDASGVTSNYTYEVPAGFPNAKKATFAWTWYNRVGNREIYMNCAPVEISGGSDSKEFYNSLPDMYVINLDNECTSVDTADVKIPNPGKFVEVGAPAVAATGSGCAAAAAAQLKGVSGYGGSSGNETSTAPSYGGSSTSAAGYGQPTSATSSSGNDGMYTQPPAASTTPETSAQSSYGSPSSATTEQPPATYAPSSGMLTVATSTSPSIQTYATLSPTSGAGVEPPSPAAPSGYSSGSASAAPSGYSSGPSSSSSSSSSSGKTGTCTSNGAVVCNGPSQFGLCNNGAVVWQAVAAGTTCENGSVQKREENGVHRHAKAHARVRRQVRAREVEGARAMREESLGWSRGEQ